MRQTDKVGLYGKESEFGWGKQSRGFEMSKGESVGVAKQSSRLFEVLVVKIQYIQETTR